jgi:hypothetical protein
LGMSPHGGIAEPTERHYSETSAGCQCARRLAGRRVPNARFGSAGDSTERPSRFARAIFRDHLLSFARMLAVLGLQLIAHQHCLAFARCVVWMDHQQ